jgi:uncharacterized protein YecT (DUF1311 family)
MKKLFFLLVFTISVATVFAQSQTELNMESSNSYKKVDDQLGVVYQVILKKYAKNVKFINALRASERLWIQFRDAEVKMMYPSDNPRMTYGSMYSMLYYGRLEELTKVRIKQLQIWAYPKEKDMQGSIGDFDGEY